MPCSHAHNSKRFRAGPRRDSITQLSELFDDTVSKTRLAGAAPHAQQILRANRSVATRSGNYAAILYYGTVKRSLHVVVRLDTNTRWFGKPNGCNECRSFRSTPMRKFAR